MWLLSPTVTNVNRLGGPKSARSERPDVPERPSVVDLPQGTTDSHIESRRQILQRAAGASAAAATATIATPGISKAFLSPRYAAADSASRDFCVPFNFTISVDPAIDLANGGFLINWSGSQVAFPSDSAIAAITVDGHRIKTCTDPNDCTDVTEFSFHAHLDSSFDPSSTCVVNFTQQPDWWEPIVPGGSVPNQFELRPNAAGTRLVLVPEFLINPDSGPSTHPVSGTICCN